MDFFSIAEPVLIICGGLFIAQSIFDFIEDIKNIRVERAKLKEQLKLLRHADEINLEKTPEKAIKFLEREKTTGIDKDFFELINEISENDNDKKEILQAIQKYFYTRNAYIDMAIKALEEQQIVQLLNDELIKQYEDEEQEENK